MRHFVLPLLVCLATFILACGSGERVGSTEPVVPLSERFGSLADAIKILPNVQVAGESVTFRGVSTLTGDAEMQFLVEGRVVGKYAQAETLFPISEVRRVRLIRPQEAASNFGQLGSNGLIELILMP